MPSTQNKKMRGDWARTVRNLIDYNLLNNELIKFDMSEEALLRGTTKPSKKKPNFDEPLSANKQKRLDQIKKLAPTERATVAGIQSLVTVFTEECNKTLDTQFELKRGDDVGRAIKQLKESQGTKLTAVSLASLSIANRSDDPSRDKKRRDKARIPFHWLKNTMEYRDPAKKGSGDPIHLGASKREKRYAITGLTIWGKKEHAGRKGTKYEGLGYQPIKGKYESFKRVGYSGRVKPDRLTTQHQFSIFWHFWQDQGRVKRVVGPVRDQMIKELNIYTKKWSKRVLDEAKKVRF